MKLPRDRQALEDLTEQWVGNLLRAGVLLAASVVLVGAVLYLVRHGASQPHLRVFVGEPADLRTIPGILADVGRGSARGIIQLGLLLLIATPIARVAFSIIAFAVERDRTYIAITLLVLALLLVGLLGGGHRRWPRTPPFPPGAGRRTASCC